MKHEISLADAQTAEMLFGGETGSFNGIAIEAPLPFSFYYDGISSRDFEKKMTWKVTIWQIQTIRHYNAETMIPDSEIKLLMDCKTYLDTGGLEWTLGFSNTGAKSSGVLSRINALDITEKLPHEQKGFVLHRLRGSDFREYDWEPFDSKIEWQSSVPYIPEQITLSPMGGKSSRGESPFFNIDWTAGGMICAIGWTGQWEAGISHTSGHKCHVTAGMVHSRYALQPGERARSPRILMMHWQGLAEDSYNQFRQIMLAHILPKINGHVPVPPIANMTTSFDKNANSCNFDDVLSHYRAVENVGFEVLWLDAYYHKGGFPNGMGNCGFPVERVVDADLYPLGIKPISDFAHERDAEFLLWFEPERVARGTLLEKEHPEWLLKMIGKDGVSYGNTMMFNLGISDACDFMVDYLGESIDKFGIDILRIDFNFDPLPYWLSGDRDSGGGDREGMTEIRYVEGLYRLWDKLLARFPRLRIDNCASGGMRIDLEMCSRSYPLWRTDATIPPLFEADYNQAAIINQLISLGLNRYVPYSTSGQMGADPYNFRSGFNAGISFADDCRAAGYPMGLLKDGIAEGKRIRRFFAGNFYAITAQAGISAESWCVMQYHLPGEDKGIVLAFRRHLSPYEKMVCDLREINRNAVYQVHISKGYRQEEAIMMSGADLQKLVLTLDQRPASMLVEYQIENHSRAE